MWPQTTHLPTTSTTTPHTAPATHNPHLCILRSLGRPKKQHWWQPASKTGRSPMAAVLVEHSFYCLCVLSISFVLFSASYSWHSEAGLVGNLAVSYSSKQMYCFSRHSYCNIHHNLLLTKTVHYTIMSFSVA